MSNTANENGVFEHKTGAGDGIVYRDKSAYIHKKRDFNKKQLKQEYIAKGDVHSVSVSEQYSQAGTYNNPVHYVPSHPISSDGYNSHINNSSQSSEAFRVNGTRTLEPKVSVEDSPIPHSDTVVNTVSDVGDPTINVSAHTSYSEISHSFQNKEPAKAHKKNKTKGAKGIDVPKSSKSRYFHEAAKAVDSVNTVQTSFRFKNATYSPSKAKETSVEKQLNKRGVNIMEDVVTPVIQDATNDDTGGEVLYTAFSTGVKVGKTYKKSKEIKEATIKSAEKKAAAKTAAKGAKKSTTSTVVQTGVKQGGTKAVASTATKSIPPMVWVWILIGIIITLLLFMVFNMLSYATTLITYGGANFISPGTKNSLDLVCWCENAEQKGWGYVYGGYGQICTTELLDRQANLYTEASGANRLAGDRWIGKPVVDCIGLIKSYAWYDVENDEISYGSNGFTDCSANSIWNNVTISGDISTIPEVPGLAVWKDGHVGVYVGNGEVIEAMGVRYGVVKTNVNSGRWSKWFKIPNIEYPSNITFN